MTPKEFDDFMKRHGLTVTDMAEVLGVTPGAIYHWIDGSRTISLIVSRCLKMFDKQPELIKEFGK